MSAAIVGAAVLLLLLLRFFFDRRNKTARARAQAEQHAQMRVFTFANHKGGVGKTTVGFLAAKHIARDRRRNVLVWDCSIYGDLTRLLLGDAGARVQPGAKDHLEKFIEEAAARWGSGFPDVKPYLRPVPGGDNNLYVLTSKTQHDNRSGDGREYGIDELPNEEMAAASQALRQALATDAAQRGRPWTVIVDTDGGLMHAMSKLALCAADQVFVPTNADPADMTRLRVMLRHLETLRAAGQSKATVTTAFFNDLVVKNNTPSAACEAFGLPFSVAPDVLEKMQRVEAQLAQDSAEFPALLAPMLRRKAGTGAEQFFCGIRNGGVGLERMKANHRDEKLAGVEGDLGTLCDRLSWQAHS